MFKPLLPPTYLLASLVVMIGLCVFLPVATVLSWPWKVTGIVPVAVGIALNLAAYRAFKRHETTVRPFAVSTSLVREGVFRFSRNPMYLGMLLILIGVALFLGALTPFAVSAVFALLMRYRFVRIEERMLADRFGAQWQRYSARVRRWV